MKTILITGAAKGIGRSIAYYFACNNYNVLITYKNSVDEANKIVKTNSNIKAIKCDVTNELDIKKLFKFIIDNYESLDIVVNNAALSMDSSIEDKTKEDYMKVLETNVVGPFLVIKEAIKYMNNGIIINICSTDGIDTYSKISIDYCASKAALINMTLNLNDNYKNNKFYAVCPNWVDTEAIREMNPDYLEEELKRIGQDHLISKDTVAHTVMDIVNGKYNDTIVRIDE